MGMNEITNVNITVQNRFVLTRQNQKGQVAIFVALIFQVIFVFFALLINVGLLVHQKINLQHSTDMAAYYGATKQAENLNAIAHINFQIRQAWKLLTWRYRVLGTFGFQVESSAPSQRYPFEYLSTGLTYNGSALGTAAMTCPSSDNLGVQDIPFFCVGHSGFKSWSQSESVCRLNCPMFSGAANSIPIIPKPSGITTPLGGNVAGAIQDAVDKVNFTTKTLCEALGPAGASLLSRFVLAYSNEVTLRTRAIEMLAKNLSLSADRVVDLDGETITKGAKTTLLNNLTEANKTGFMEDQYVVDNGLSKCPFRTGNSFEDKGQREFLKKIEFSFINYFIHNCKDIGSARDYIPENVYANNSLGPAFNNLDQKVRDIMLSMLIKDQMHTVGYEKNPYCVEYFAVRSSSTPNIPFLPLSKIKLNAVAIAKPFGGTIGPSYGRTWSQGATISDYSDADVNSRTDLTLPQRALATAGTLSDIKQSMMLQPNFSLYVGDQKGLRDLDYIAAFHSMLGRRDIATYDGASFPSNDNGSGKLSNTGTWPNFDNWDGIDNSTMVDLKQYDTMVKPSSGVRGIEISAIAPNQFDIYYYSIDPDFFNNYYKRIYKAFNKISSAAGMSSSFIPDQLRSDFGAINPDPNLGSQPVALGDPRAFSVRDQILLKNQVLNTSPKTDGPGKPPNRYVDVLDYLVTIQSSLLTGWTFLNYTTYSVFPGGNVVNGEDKTMTFGKCNDAWNKTTDNDSDKFTASSFGTPMNTNSKLPPVPGNCVTGGRTGYSVKIVTPDMVRKADYLVNPVSDFIFDF